MPGEEEETGAMPDTPEEGQSAVETNEAAVESGATVEESSSPDKQDAEEERHVEKNDDAPPAPASSESAASPQGEPEPEKDTQTTSQEESTGEPKATAEAAAPSAPSPAAAAANSGSIGSSKGAQILMNRFSSLKQRANQNAQTLWNKGTPTIATNAKVLQENAKTLWQQAPKIPVSAAGFSTSLGSGFMSKTTAGQTTSDGDAQATTQPQPKGEEGTTSDKAEISAKEFSLESEVEASDEARSPTKAPESTVESQDGNTVEEESSSDGAATATTEEARLRVGAAISKASVAATVVAESVATGFRGRYTAATATGDATPGEDDTTKAETKPDPESQTSIILKSRAGQHMQSILDKLETHEYAMLLGKGMLGVNLKQCYLKNHGVFVDYCVPGGQAEGSGVIKTGDLLTRLGESDLRKGTIMEIPRLIANAKRPSALVLAKGTSLPMERMNYIDVVVAMMHRAREYYGKRGTLSNLPSASGGKPSNQNGEKAQSMEIKSVSEVEVPLADSLESFITPPAPTLDVQREFVDEVAKRSFEKFIVAGLCEVQDMDSNFRAAVHNAFLTCALDSRRLPFLARHLSEQDELAKEGTNVEGKMTPSAQLMLFLELTSFLDLYDVTPSGRLRDVASRVAYKFFLPTKIGEQLQPPLFDFHHIVPDASLRHLEFVLSGKSETIPRDVFFDFSKAVVESLTGAPFVSFLASSECAKMRAYLRDTAPLVNVPVREIVDSLGGEAKNAGAKNCFAYILLFLICQLEKEPSGEYNFSNEPEPPRLLGASNDISCAIFIKRSLVPTLESAAKQLGEIKEESEFDAATAENVLNTCEKFWDIYITGALEISTKGSEIETCYNSARKELERVAHEITKAGGDIKVARSTVETIVNSKLVQLSRALADELLHNYAANVHTKFREHKFHEWMCNEVCKVRASDPNWSLKQGIPPLTQGCLKRLLRKVELPDGVSSHKPWKSPSQEEDSEPSYPNAEFAVVFGSSVGDNIAAQIPVPGIETSDIRRYACFPVGLDHDHELESFSAEHALPPTFESYASVPPMKPRSFGAATDLRLSKDGWEVSLVSFSIPNAESSGAESALFGVSLHFLCKPDQEQHTQKGKINSFVHTEGDTEKECSENKEFKSPISFTTREASANGMASDDGASAETVRTVNVSTAMPIFNDKLSGTRWVERVAKDEHRDPAMPVSIGLALVSRKNVILAMRDTLTRLLSDYSRDESETKISTGTFSCGALIDVLGNFTHQDVESASLRCILEPYLHAASSPWIDRPISCQSQEFEALALRQLTDCLPPTPLALFFVAALLEQKIVLSSSRRSVLYSATVALSALTQPLKWSHLLVPQVPSTLAGDLLQYPAPFILGVPSEEGENGDLLGKLPRDVTLVDLDVGRVILAPEFGHDNEMVRRSADQEATAKALRSQVLFLAQALGEVFGNCLRPTSWLCDSPIVCPPERDDISARIAELRASAHSFVNEILKGIAPCCYWIEEATSGDGTTTEPTVLFDEVKFFEIKHHRAASSHKPLFPRDADKDFALSLDTFDLVLESFLRCQSMSTYISSRPKTNMLYY